MKIAEQTLIRTIEANGVKCLVKVTYPAVSDAKGCERINALFSECIREFIDFATKNARYDGEIFTLIICVKYCDDKILSVLFDKKRKTGRDVRRGRTVCATLDCTSGRLLPLLSLNGGLYGKAMQIRAQARKCGIRIPFSALKRQFFVTGDGITVYDGEKKCLLDI